MRKLLVILLISIVFCRYDYDLIKNSFNCLKEKGFLDKIRMALFMSGELVAIEKCAIYLQYCPEVKPSEEPSEKPEPTEEPSDEQTDKPTDKPENSTDESTDKPFKAENREIRRLQDVVIYIPIGYNVNTNKTDEQITDPTDGPKSDLPVSDEPKETEEPEEPVEPDKEQMMRNRAICLRIFGYF